MKDFEVKIGQVRYRAALRALRLVRIVRLLVFLVILSIPMHWQGRLTSARSRSTGCQSARYTGIFASSFRDFVP
jgi:hypothetical protein